VLNIRRLMLIRDLAEYGTISAVSELHGITSSAVSQSLRALEEEVGSVLMRREGRVLRLTYAGQVLVQHTSKVLHALNEAESAIAATQNTTSGVVTLIGFQTALVTLAGGVLDRLRRHHPDLRLRLVDGNKQPALKAVRSGEADLAIVYDYSFNGKTSPDWLDSRYMFTDPLVLLAPPAMHERIDSDGISALADTDWIAAHEGAPSVESIQHNCRTAGFSPRIQHRCQNFTSMAHLVEADAGVTIVPRIAVPTGLEHLAVTSHDHGARHVSVCYPRGAGEKAGVSETIRALQAVVRTRLAGDRWFRGDVGFELSSAG
jgi:DNA-binding transcriptional LysR family regulator